MSGLLRGRKVRALVVLLVLLIAVAAYSALRHFYPVTAAEGWDYSVYAQHIPMVSALAKDGQNEPFFSEELAGQRGRIMQLQPDGSMKEVLSGLSKPDGLVMFNGGLVIGQEGGDLPLLFERNGTFTTLFEGKSIEGVATDGHLLYVIEDRQQDGRLMSYDPQNGQLNVLREGLVQAEGVAACPDGQLYYTEKTHGVVKRWSADGVDPIVASDLNAPGYVQCSSDGLWITEDATHGARLLLLGNDGYLRTVLSHLRSAQTIIELESGHYLISEQGRERILEVFQRTDARADRLY